MSKNPSAEAIRERCVARTPEVQRAVRHLAAATFALEELEWKGDVALYVEERIALRAAIERAELYLDETWERVAAAYDSAVLAAHGDRPSVF